MKKILCVLFIITALPAFAANWQTRSVTNEKDKNIDEFVCLKDASGNIFYVEDGLNIPEEQADIIIRQKDALVALELIKVKELKFHFENGVLEVSLIPADLKYNNTDLAPYLSTGMLFSLENGALVYNFRIRKDNYFLRINGTFTSEKYLLEKVFEAVTTPQTFVQRRDPDYMLSAIDKLSRENEALRRAIIALNNKGFFSSDGPVDDKLISRIKDLKAQKPGITQKEIEETLEKEKTPFTTRAVSLVLNVYFNEFAK